MTYVRNASEFKPAKKKPGVRERERQTPISSSPRGPRPEYVDNGAK